MKTLRDIALFWLLKKAVKQGYRHREETVFVLIIMRKALEEEFTEDNHPTLKAYFDSCADEAWRFSL